MSTMHTAYMLATLLLSQAGAAAGVPLDVAPGVTVLRGEFVPGAQPDGNSVLFEAPDGLVVFDTGRHAAHTQRIVDLARESGKPVVAIVNSHWHLDHVGGNAVLRREFPDAKVYAAPTLREAIGGFLARYRKQLETMLDHAEDDTAKAPLLAEIALIDAGPALMPDVEIAEPGRRVVGGLELRVGFEPGAVTAGDVWIYDPHSRVLAAGDLATLPVPFLDTACPRRWNDALKHLARVEFTTLVPGHGPPLTREAFGHYRRAYGRLLDCAASKRAKGECADGWIADLGPLLADADQAFTRQLLDYYLDQHLRAPPGTRQVTCD